MALPFYLAMTAGELLGNKSLPRELTYMACHFSPYGTGLSGCPGELPEGSLLILNDRTPIWGHDKNEIGAQLSDMATSWNLRGVLLDFQRPGLEESAALAAHLVDSLPCPVIVSEGYAGELDCPVLLPPVPLDETLTEYLSPFQGREIWLEMAMDGLEILLTKDGARRTALPYPAFDGREFADEVLHCHYHIEAEKDAARFSLRRTREDIENLLRDAEGCGITAALGLWQEFS